MSGFPHAQRVLREAVASRIAPCAVVEVGDCSGVLWREASGRLTFDDGAPAASEETVFDLASLTKVLASTLLAMRLVDDRRLDLDTLMADLLPRWRGEGRETARVSNLLTHSSGLKAHAPLYRSCSGREDFERAICSESLEYPTGTRSVYSDLGFILLGFVLEDVAGEALDRQFERMCHALRGEMDDSRDSSSGPPIDIQFRARAEWRDRIAPTREAPSHHGIVDDDNAAALGGVAGHAGLFGTASAAGTLARAMLRATLDQHDKPAVASQETAIRFVTRAGIPGSSRALGWDTMLPTSSCGTRMSHRAFGHTGFTGTSVSINPAAEGYVILLTNRVFPTAGSAEGMTGFRRALHDAVMTGVTFSNRQG